MVIDRIITKLQQLRLLLDVPLSVAQRGGARVKNGRKISKSNNF